MCSVRLWPDRRIGGPHLRQRHRLHRLSGRAQAAPRSSAAAIQHRGRPRQCALREWPSGGWSPRRSAAGAGDQCYFSVEAIVIRAGLPRRGALGERRQILRVERGPIVQPPVEVGHELLGWKPRDGAAAGDQVAFDVVALRSCATLMSATGSWTLEPRSSAPAPSLRMRSVLSNSASVKKDRPRSRCRYWPAAP